MLFISIRTVAIATIAIAGMMTCAAAQTSAPDPHMGQDQPTQPNIMGGEMMRMHHGMMQGGMMQPGMMGMRGHGMRIMFAIADADGDTALSFEEVTAIHKRIFDAVDADRDGKATREELQNFMQAE